MAVPDALDVLQGNVVIQEFLRREQAIGSNSRSFCFETIIRALFFFHWQ